MNLSKRNSKTLTPQVFHILLALLGHERQAANIRSRISQDSMMYVVIGSSTLYEALPRLIKQGLIEIAPRTYFANDLDKNYRLTPQGQRALESEIRRLEIALKTAKGRLLAAQYRLTETIVQD
jgi:DNA-binding PadR family transcriptional regulator